LIETGIAGKMSLSSFLVFSISGRVNDSHLFKGLEYELHKKYLYCVLIRQMNSGAVRFFKESRQLCNAPSVTGVLESVKEFCLKKRFRTSKYGVGSS